MSEEGERTVREKLHPNQRRCIYFRVVVGAPVSLLLFVFVYNYFSSLHSSSKEDKIREREPLMGGVNIL